MSKNNNPTWKKVTEQEFATTKQLQAMGLNASKIRKITGRGLTAVGRMFEVESLEDYRQLTLAAKAKTDARKAAKAASARIEPTAEVATETEEIEEDQHLQTSFSFNSKHDTLVRIAEALERLADAWENSPTPTSRRRLF
jgi:hypothetical protein